MRPPDTEIPCPICRGRKRRVPGTKTVIPCGACFATGLSTSSYDQKRNGTTVTLWEGEDRPLRPGTTIHDPSILTNRRVGERWQTGGICLIYWPNPDYEHRLALLKAGKL